MGERGRERTRGLQVELELMGGWHAVGRNEMDEGPRAEMELTGGLHEWDERG